MTEEDSQAEFFKKYFIYCKLLTNPCPTSIQGILASVPSTGLVQEFPQKTTLARRLRTEFTSS